VENISGPRFIAFEAMDSNKTTTTSLLEKSARYKQYMLMIIP